MERNPNENKQNLLLNRQKVDLPFESGLVLNYLCLTTLSVQTLPTPERAVGS